MKYTPQIIKQMAAKEDARLGLPIGLTASVIQQETGFNDKFLVDQRVPHYTGPKPKSTAAGLGGFLEGTARDPGYGVKPLGNDWSIPNQVRFASELLAANIKRKGSIDKGLMAYGTGKPEYANAVLSRVGWKQDPEQPTVTPIPKEQAVQQQVQPMSVATNPPTQANTPIPRFGEGIDTRLSELNALINSQNRNVVPMEYVAAKPLQSDYVNPFWDNFKKLTGLY